jgi:uncharacterized protein with beta-barrel porin domain
MKRIAFSRKAILRAIHAAALALYLAAIATAHAQTATGDGHGNVTITGSGSNTFSLGPTSSPPLAAGGTLTIAAGANASQPMTSTSGYEIQINTVGTTTNSGYVGNANSTFGNSFALAYTSVSTAGNVTVQNTSTGTITESVYGNTGAGIYIQNVTHGSISITNNGQITVQQDDAFVPPLDPSMTGIYANDSYASGTITLTNTGTISAVYAGAESAYAANLATSGSGGITVTNNGTMTALASLGGGSVFGLDLSSSGSGNISVTNSGSISGSGYASGVVAGILAQASGSGAISITNSGSVSGSNTANGQSTFGIDVSNTGSGAVTITNSGPVTANTIGTASGIYVNDSGTGSIVITNKAGGTISSYSSAAQAYGVYVNSAGTAQVTNAAAIDTSASAGGFGLDVTGTSASITNTGAITAGSGSGVAYAIDSGSSVGTLSIANSAALSATSGTGSAYDIVASGAGDTTIETTGHATLTATAISPYGNPYGILASNSAGTITITNQQAMSISGYKASGGIDAAATAGLTITNSGALTVQNSYFDCSGITGSTASGSVSITNASTGTISSTSVNGTAYGLNAQTTPGSISIGNAAAIHATSTNSTAYAIYLYTHTGTGTVANTGALTSSGGSSAYGIYAFGANGDSPNYTITNSASIQTTATGTESGGITVEGNSIQIANQGAITATGTGSSYASGIDAAGGTISITNSGSLHVSSVNAGILGLYGSATTTSTITNTQALSASSTSSYAYGIYSRADGASTVTNSGALTVSAGTAAYGINAKSTGGLVQVGNSAAIHATSTTGTVSAIYTYTATGTETVANTGAITVSAEQTGIGLSGKGNAAAITNSGRVTINSSAGAYGIYTVTTNNSTITNRASGAVSTTSSAYYAFSIYGYSSAGTVQITNAAAVQATSTNGSYGIYVNAAAGANVSNTQTITSTNTGSGYADGIFAESPNGDVTLTNSATITATASGNSASGLYAKALNGNVTLTNSGHVVALSQTGSYTTSGIYVVAGSGTTSVTNSGYAGGFTEGGTGYGIYIDPTGPITVSNTGTAKGSLAGIFLAGAGTVNNSGLASGGTYSIDVPTGSTVNLRGASPVQGLLKGGADASSTSTLNFDIVIRGNFNAQKTSLDNAITAYGLAYTAAGGVGDVDSSVVVLNGIDYQWEDFLNIADNLIQGRLYGTTPGYHGIGNAVDNFDPNSARGAAILAALDNLPESGVANALAQLSPKALQVFRNIAFDGASFTAANLNNHLANLRDGLTGFDTSGFTVNTPGVDPTLTQMKSRLLAFNPAPFDPDLLSDSSSSLFGGMDMKDTKSMVNTQPVDRWSAFISGSVVLANLDNTTSNIGDADYTTGSILAGVDYRLTDHLTVGAAFNYAHTGASLDGNGSKATVDSYAPGIYASYVNKGWYGNALLMYGFNNNTDDRQVTIPGIQGDNHGASDGGQVTSNLTGGYEFQKGSFKFGPVASVQYVHLSIDSMQEDGPTALTINSQDEDSFRSQLGVEGRFNANVGAISLTPHVSASWQHEYLDDSRGINAQFTGAGGGSFVTQTDSPDRDAAFLDVGLDATVAKNVTLFVDYETQVGQQNYFAQSAEGGVKIGF